MRNIFLSISTIAVAILFAANTNVKNWTGQAAFFEEVKLPVLPEQHYQYAPENLPEHLFGEIPTSTTSWGNADITVPFVAISNEIATLGRVLFYDEILSANNNLACATCHLQEKSFADDSPFSTGVNTMTDVNSMHLNDLGWSNRAGFFWDMSQTDLTSMIALPLTNPNEIGVTNPDHLIQKISNTSYYPALFNDAFGGNIINYSRVRLALSQFISSMTTFNSRFDRVKMNQESYTQIEKAGEQLFIDNCSICHTDGISSFINVIADFEGGSSAVSAAPFLFDNGLPLKNGDLGAGVWNSDFEGLFKAPTLRNIEKTGPYMHDGRFETLEEVIDHYSEGVTNSVDQWDNPLPFPSGGFDFNAYEKGALVHFLKSLTDKKFLKDEKFSDPLQLFEIEEEEEIIEEQEEVQEEDKFPFRTASVVYPNPTIGTLNVGFENLNKRLVVVYILDINGHVVRKLSSHYKGLTTDLSLLPKGIYTVRVMKTEKVWEDHQVLLQ